MKSHPWPTLLKPPHGIFWLVSSQRSWRRCFLKIRSFALAFALRQHVGVRAAPCDGACARPGCHVASVQSHPLSRGCAHALTMSNRCVIAFFSSACHPCLPPTFSKTGTLPYRVSNDSVGCWAISCKHNPQGPVVPVTDTRSSSTLVVLEVHDLRVQLGVVLRVVLDVPGRAMIDISSEHTHSAIDNLTSRIYTGC